MCVLQIIEWYRTIFSLNSKKEANHESFLNIFCAKNTKRNSDPKVTA